MSFHALVVFALGKNLLFKFALGHCVHKIVLSAVENDQKYLYFLLFLKFSDTQNGWWLRIAIYHEITGAAPAQDLVEIRTTDKR